MRKNGRCEKIRSFKFCSDQIPRSTVNEFRLNTIGKYSSGFESRPAGSDPVDLNDMYSNQIYGPN